MGSHDVTVRLDDELRRRAETLAARRGISMNRLLAEALGRVIDEADVFDDGRRRALSALDEARPRGGRGWSRSELHER